MKQPPNLIVDEDEPDSGHAGPSPLATVLAALLLIALTLSLLVIAAAELGRLLP